MQAFLLLTKEIDDNSSVLSCESQWLGSKKRSNFFLIGLIVTKVVACVL